MVDADVLGRAYEKYLANVYMTAPSAPQLRLFDQPTRDVEPLSVKKSGGIFYTPSYLVGTLTEQAIAHSMDGREDFDFLPRIADFACGSGSFLVEAVSVMVRRLRERDPGRNWARVLVEGKHIVGIDIDPRAVTLTRMNLWIRLTEEPDALPLPSISEAVFLGDSLAESVWENLPESYDVIVGNPPFLATGSVRSRDELAQRFQTAQGRFDYSHLFVELGIRRLSPGGILGMVVSNRLFRNRDARIVRELLTNQTDILSIIDFGSNEVFKGTSGYIGAVVARKRASQERMQPSNVRVVVVSDVSDTRYLGGLLADACNATTEFAHDRLVGFDIPYPSRGGVAWVLLSPETRRNRVRLEENSTPLGEFAGVYQGIRTGANDIFIVRVESTDGTLARVTNGLGDTAVIEIELLRPAAFGSDIQRYDLLRPNSMLVYPYKRGVALSEGEIQENYPKAYSYLFAYRDLLSHRSSIIAGGLRWYELVRKREEGWLTALKLLTRDLAPRTSFALDDSGVFLVGGTAVVSPDPQFALPLLGYLNSRVASEYLAELTPAFRGAFQKFEPQHLNQLPVPDFIVDLDSRASVLGELARKAVNARVLTDDDDTHEVESEIDSLVEASAFIA